ncbi:MAG: hypothetical protein HFG80_10675 [Eubacterium sp.]|nr:hypothetical protein [Eubacterium sp.]
MRYRTKVEVVTNGKTYEPSSILPEDIPASDLAFLKIKKFVVPVDADAVISEPVEDETDDGAGFGGDFSGFDEMQPGKLKSEAEIRKIRSKKEIRAYAGSIGFDLGENSDEKSLKELQEAVINFQEEQMENDGGSGTGGSETGGTEEE